MSVRWVCRPSQPDPLPSFDTREEAEAWMGAEWATLLEAGVDAVTLVDGDDEVYTMKLTPA